jgi:predicted metal-dependent hydrolase
MAEPLRADLPPYAIRRSDRARRVRVTVEPDGAVVVVLPRRMPERAAADAVVHLRGWIERRVAEAHARRARNVRPPGTVPYLGRDLALRPETGRTRAHRRGDVLHVPAADPARTEALERFYRRAARAEALPRVEAAAAALGRRCTALTIRNQRTRWGSCSAKGAIALNWRLLLAPEPVLDYVVWHEACHLVHLDHSPRFWALLAHHLPDFRDPQRWLRDNGGALQL